MPVLNNNLFKNKGNTIPGINIGINKPEKAKKILDQIIEKKIEVVYEREPIQYAQTDTLISQSTPEVFLSKNVLLSSHLSDIEIKKMLNFYLLTSDDVENLYTIYESYNLNDGTNQKFNKFLTCLYYETMFNIESTSEALIDLNYGYINVSDIYFVRDYIPLYRGKDHTMINKILLSLGLNPEIAIFSDIKPTDLIRTINPTTGLINKSPIEGNSLKFKALHKQIQLDEQLRKTLNKIYSGTIHY